MFNITVALRPSRAIASAAALLALSSSATAATTATWVAPVTGNWTDPTKWSTNPNYPNNGSPTSADTYDVLISQLGSAYNVNLNAPIIVDNLTLNSPNVTLRNSSDFTLQNITITSGQLRLLNNSRLFDATITAPAGAMPITATGFSTLRNVSLGAGLILDGTDIATGFTTVYNENPRSMAGGTISFVSGPAPAQMRSHSLTGIGEIVFNGTGTNAISAFPGVPLTIGSGITVRTGTRGGSVGFTGETIINEGLFSAQTSGMTLSMGGASATNHGTVEARNGGTIRIVNLVGPLGNYLLSNGTLEFDGTTILQDPINITAGNALTLRGKWTNSGGININGGQINFGTIASSIGTITHTNATFGVVGPLTTGQLETVPYTDFSRLEIAAGAALNNTGKTLLLPANVASRFTGGTITGGAIEGGPGASLLDTASGLLDGVTLNVDSSGSLTFQNGLVVNKVHRGGISAPTLGGSETISGTGEIFLNGSFLQNARNANLTIGSGLTVRSETGHSQIGRFPGSITNNGQIITGGWSVIFATATTNTGTINVTDSYASNMAPITNNGVINIAAGSYWDVSEAFTSNGTIGGAGAIYVDAPTVIGGTQNWLPGAAIDLLHGTVHLNSNAGTPATSSAPASANLHIIADNYDDGGFTLAADQDLHSASIKAWQLGDQSLDLNSPTAPGAFRSMRVYDTEVALARDALYYAIVNANGPSATSPTDGIFDSNLSAHPNSRIGLAQVLDEHGDAHLLVRPTRIGDLNLDGAVTIADFIILSSNFNKTNAFWDEGDINYDRQVTIADFIELSANFNSTYSGQSFAISQEDAAILANFASANVPEPVAIIPLIAVASLLNSRRRRREIGNNLQ